MNSILRQGLNTSSFFALSLIYKYLLENVLKGKKLYSFRLTVALEVTASQKLLK